MRALVLSRWRLPPARDLLALAAAGAYVIVFTRVVLGQQVPVGVIVVFVPLCLLPVALVRRVPLTPSQAIALGVTTILPLALAWSLLISFSWLTALVVPAMVLAAMLCSRYPAAAVTLLFVCATAYGSLKEYLGWPAQRSIDVLLGGLWLAAMWRWFVFPRPRARLVVWPGVACVAAYIVFTAGEILTADTLNVGLQSFRQSVWYLAAALLVAYAPWKDASRERIEKIAIAAVLLVGAYATLRWITGPTGKEEAVARAVKNNFNGDKLRPIGSFITVKEMAAWSAAAVPFAAGMALALRGRWRLVAIAGTIAATTVMFSADVRAGPAAAVPAVLVVLVLYALSQAFRGHRGATVVIAVWVTLAVGAGAFALTVGGDPGSGRRYKAILHPTTDESYQARVIKWRTAWDDIGHAPLGYGLGTSGRVQERFGQFTNVANFALDNSYLKVAYEQGFVVMVLYGGAIILLLLGLARRALVTPDRTRAGPAIAACGTLTALLILFFIGNYAEGVSVLSGWLFVGVGLSRFTWAPWEPPPPEPAPAPGNAW